MSTANGPDDEGKIVSPSQKATIPRELREKHGIEPVPTLREFRGAATTDPDGTSILEAERERDADGA